MRCLVALAFVVVAGCTTAPDVSEQSASLNGRVVKGPVGAATVTVTPVLTPDALGSATTAADGSFTVQLSNYTQGDLRVCATGGRFVDEATTSEVELGSSSLCTVVLGFQLLEQRAGAVITPWTALAVARADSQVGLYGVMPYSRAWDEARAAVAGFLSCNGTSPDVFDADPADPTAAREGAAELTPQLISGLLIAGLSQQAKLISDAMGITPGVSVTSLSVVDAYARDLSDGIFDGRARNDALDLAGYGITADTIRGEQEGFAQGVRAFLVSDRNTTGVAVADLYDLLACIASATGPLFAAPPEGALDLDGPALTFENPKPGDVVAGTVAVVVTATDASEIDDLWFDPAPGLGTRLPAIDGHNATIEAELVTASLPDGPYTITANGRDALGNPSTAALEISINNGAPSVALEVPVAGSGVAGVQTLVVTASDPQGVASLTVTSPPGLVDVDSNPARFEASWDTRSTPDGAFALTAYAEDADGNGASSSFGVIVDNNAPGRATGHVALDTPVLGAHVQALAVVDGARNRVLAAGVVDNAGAFTLELPDNYTGPLLLRAFGTSASYTDLATGLAVTFGVNDELVLLTDYAPSAAGTALDDLSINAVTTLAASLAFRLAPTSSSFADASVLAHQLWNQHLQRPEAFDARTTRVSDYSSDPIADSSESLEVGIWHVGLSRLGAELATSSGQARTSLPTLKLLSFIERDLEDAVLDGRGLSGVVLVAPSVQLETNTMRARHALAILAWLDGDVLPDGSSGNPNTTSLISANFAGPGGLLEDISSDTSQLFGSEPPAPFDIIGPAVAIVTPAAGTYAGMLTIRATATDASGIQGMLGYIDARPSAVIGADTDPAVDGYTATLDTTKLADGKHRLRIVALDRSGNAALAEIDLGVDNSAPVLTVDSLPAVIAGSPSIHGTVDDTGAGTSVSVSVNNGALTALASPATSSFTQVVTVPCNATGLSIRVVARNAAGLTSEWTWTGSCDDRVPSLALQPSEFYPPSAMDVSVNTTNWVVEFTRSLAGAPVALETLPWSGAEPTILEHHFNRFDYLPAAGITEATQGFPMLLLVPADNLTSGTLVYTPASQLVVDYRYIVGGAVARNWTQLAPDAGDIFKLRFSYQTLGPQLQDATGTTLHTVTVRVRDVAGNVTTRDFSFKVTARIPPVFLVDCASGDGPSAYTLTSASPSGNNLNFYFGSWGANTDVLKAAIVVPTIPTGTLATWRYRLSSQPVTAHWNETSRHQYTEALWSNTIACSATGAPHHASCNPMACPSGTRAASQQGPFPTTGFDYQVCEQGFWPVSRQAIPAWVYWTPSQAAHQADPFINAYPGPWDVPLFWTGTRLNLKYVTPSTPLTQFDSDWAGGSCNPSFGARLVRSYEARNLSYTCGACTFAETRQRVCEYLGGMELTIAPLRGPGGDLLTASLYATDAPATKVADVQVTPSAGTCTSGIDQLFTE